MFVLYGGRFNHIDKKSFIENLDSVTKALSTHFSSEQNLIMRNGKYLKENSNLKKVLDEVIPIVANFQHRNYMKEQIEKTTSDIFGHENELIKEVFIDKIEEIMKAKDQQDQAYLWLYFDLLRLELKLL